MERYLKVADSFFKKQYLPHMLVALLMCLMSGGFMSFRNLDLSQAAKIIEMYGAFFGIIFFPPLFMPEQDKEFWALEKSKAMPIWKHSCVRMLGAIIFLGMATTLFVVLILHGSSGISVNDGVKLWINGFCEVLFLGSIGFFFSAVTNQMVIGYMAAIVYYAVNIGSGKYFCKFALFQMVKGKYDFGIYMLSGALVLLMAGVIVRERKEL